MNKIVQINDDKTISYLKEIIFDSLPDGLFFKSTRNPNEAKLFTSKKEVNECIKFLTEELASFYKIEAISPIKMKEIKYKDLKPGLQFYCWGDKVGAYKTPVWCQCLKHDNYTAVELDPGAHRFTMNPQDRVSIIRK